ncbi:MAG: hypothetical protein JWR26_3348 [Pedosphaera sp.]|nr:hypothetical protein [Pedosphaera sp.]
MATGDDDAGFVGVQDGAGRAGWVGDFCVPDFEELRAGFGGQMGVCAGPGGEGADAVPEGAGGLGPIELAIFLGDLAGEGGAFGGLGAGNDFAGDEVGNGLDEEVGTQGGEAIVQGLGIVLGVDGGGLAGEDVAGIEAGIHFHDGDAGLGLVVEDGPLDGGGAAIFGEDGGVDVEGTEAGQIQNGFGEDLAIRGNGDEVGLELAEFLNEGFVAGAFGLEDGQAGFEGDFFYGRRLQFQVAAFGAVGLGDDGEDGEVGLAQQCFQAGAGERGGAHEDDFERRHWSGRPRKFRRFPSRGSDDGSAAQ